MHHVMHYVLRQDLVAILQKLAARTAAGELR